MSKVINFLPGLSLEDLQIQLCAYENNPGPLLDLERTTDFTAGIFEEGPPPDKSLELLLKVNGQANVPTGYDKVCDGKIWVLNVPQSVLVIRKQ